MNRGAVIDLEVCIVLAFGQDIGCEDVLGAQAQDVADFVGLPVLLAIAMDLLQLARRMVAERSKHPAHRSGRIKPHQRQQHWPSRTRPRTLETLQIP